MLALITEWSLRIGCQANWPAVKMILPSWFDLLEEGFSFSKSSVQKSKRFAHL